MKIVIIGMGAVGGVIAGYLLKNNINVIGIVSNKHFLKIKQNGFHFIDINSNDHLFKAFEENEYFKILPSLESASKTDSQTKLKTTSLENKNLEKEYEKVFSALTSDDWIIITSKAYSLPEICKQYKNYIEKHGEALLIQNGIGNEEIVRKFLPNLLIYRGTTTNGALLLGAGHVKHTGIGNIKLGIPSINNDIIKTKFHDSKPMKAKLLKLKSVFEKCGFITEYSENIDQILWEKIMINIGINAPATIRNIQNGDLLKDETAIKEMEAAITEAWNVGRALGISLDEDVRKYINLTKDVAKKTAQNRNSMLQDIENKKPTEIKYINGKIVEYGKKLGLKTPVNERLTNIIIEMENDR